MADGLGFSILSDSTLGALKQVEREVRRANSAAVRQAGQALAAEAKRRAPVYEGPRPDVPKGRLRKSIRAGRVRTQDTTAMVTVGPRGQRVKLYASRQEERTPYMDPAYRAMSQGLEVIAARAYTAAINRGSRK